MQNYLKQTPGVDSWAGYFEALEHSTSGNVFAFKTSYKHFSAFGSNLTRLFPRSHYVLLDRFDIEAQAVSLYRAASTGTFHAKRDVKTAQKPVPFDKYAILSALKRIQREKLGWEQFFFEQRISPLRLYYELFSNDLKRALDMIVEHVGFSSSIVPEDISGDYVKLSDSNTDKLLSMLRSLRSGKSK